MLDYLPQKAGKEIMNGLLGLLFVVAEDERDRNILFWEDCSEVMDNNRPDVPTISPLTSSRILGSYARTVFPAPAIPHWIRMKVA
jgi:hypothetical protein